MANGETVDKILHAATLLFSERGFAETSLRTITSLADVNLAAVNYHFGSKQALIQAVFSRVLQPFCVALDTRLASLNPQPVQEAKTLAMKPILMAITEAFIETQKALGERPDRFAKLMLLAYTQSQEHLRQYCNARFGQTLTRLLSLLQQAAPHLSPVDFFWRMNFMLGASLFTLSSFDSLIALLHKAPDDMTLEDMTLEDIVPYLVPAMTQLLASPCLDSEPV